MPNSVKYNTESEANALTIGNMHVGAGDVPKGPTSSTGFYNGINPPNGGYTIYLNKSTQGPSIYTPSNDAELISITNEIAGASYTTINECFSYFAGQSDKFVLHNPINFMVTDGLILNLSSNILPSYPRSSTTWYDLSGGSNNTTISSANYNSGGGYFQSVGSAPGSLIFSTPNSTTISNTFSVTSGGWTIEELIRIDDTTYPEAAAGTAVSGRAYGSNETGFDWNHGVMSGASLNIDMSNKDTGGGASRDAEVNLAIDSDLQTYGQWILRSIYWDRTNDKCGVYYNGRFQDSGSISGVSGYSLYDGGGIAWGTLYGWVHDGARSLMRVYNKVLSESEVLQNYYQAPIVTDGLVFAADAGNLVSYENGSATSYSLTGSNNGALTNGVGFDSSNGGTWTFDGVDDRIVTQTNSVLGTFSDWSMDAWIKYENSGYSGWMIVVDQATYSQYQKNIMVWLSSDATNKKIAMYDGSWQYSASTIPVSTWTHISATTEGNTAKMYINGELDVTRTFNWSNTSNVTNYMGIGSHGSNPSYKMNGNIAVVKIYDKVLTADEVTQNYKANINRFN